MLYRLQKVCLLTMLHDHPIIKSKMTGVAQSRHRRLAHNADMVCKSYLRSFFVIDFCSSVLLDLILKSVSALCDDCIW